MLPLDQLRQDIRPLVLLREFPTSSGPIDALATDDEANLYLIDNKSFTRTQTRDWFSPRFSTTVRPFGRLIQTRMNSYSVWTS